MESELPQSFWTAYNLIIWAIVIIQIVAYWKIYLKASQPGWASIIPIYNIIILLMIIKKPWWWIFLLLIPIVNIVFNIMILHALSKSFGEDTGFTVGLVLLPFIFLPVLAFGKFQYIGAGVQQTNSNHPPMTPPQPPQTPPQTPQPPADQNLNQ